MHNHLPQGHGGPARRSPFVEAPSPHSSQALSTPFAQSSPAVNDPNLYGNSSGGPPVAKSWQLGEDCSYVRTAQPVPPPRGAVNAQQHAGADRVGGAGLDWVSELFDGSRVGNSREADAGTYKAGNYDYAPPSPALAKSPGFGEFQSQRPIPGTGDYATRYQTGHRPADFGGGWEGSSSGFPSEVRGGAGSANGLASSVDGLNFLGDSSHGGIGPAGFQGGRTVYGGGSGSRGVVTPFGRSDGGAGGVEMRSDGLPPAELGGNVGETATAIASSSYGMSSGSTVGLRRNASGSRGTVQATAGSVGSSANVLKSPFGQPERSRGTGFSPAPSDGPGVSGGASTMGSAFPVGSLIGSSGGGVQSHLVNAVVASVAGEVVPGMTTQNVSAMQTWLPETYANLKRYFAVSHSDVISKLFKLLLPFVAAAFRSRRRNSAEGWQPKHSGSGGITVNAAGPSADAHSRRVSTDCDLYIPLMAFITYILLFGLTRGTLDDFHPELLSSISSFALILLVLEVIVVKGGFYFLGGGSSAAATAVLELVAICGHKFVGLAIIVGCGLICKGKYDIVYWGTFGYCSFCSFVYVLRSLKKADSQSAAAAADWGVRKSAHVPLVYFLWAAAACQVPLSWLLTPSWSVVRSV